MVYETLQWLVACNPSFCLFLADAGDDGWEDYEVVIHVIIARRGTRFHTGTVLPDMREDGPYLDSATGCGRWMAAIVGTSLKERLFIVHGYKRGIRSTKITETRCFGSFGGIF